MRTGSFKCLTKYLSPNGKNINHPGCYRSLRGNIGFSGAADTSYIWSKTGFSKSYDHIISNFNINLGSFIFFIQRRLVNQDEQRKKRQRHFERLNDKVFNIWIEHGYSEDEARMVLQRTYHDLQLNITGLMGTSDEHVRAELHLESYNGATGFIQQIRIKEEEFNRKVSQFANEMPMLIVNSVESVDPSFHEYQTSDNDSMCYARSNIGDYLFKCVQNIPLELIIVENQTDVCLSKLVIDQGGNFVAIADNANLQKVKTVLENLRDDTIKQVAKIMQERISIAKIFEEKLKPIVNDIVSSIDNEESIKGGCGLSYCPGPKSRSLPKILRILCFSRS